MFQVSLIKRAFAAVSIACFCATGAFALESAHITLAQAGDVKTVDANGANGSELKTTSANDIGGAPAKRKHHRRHKKHRRSHARRHRNNQNGNAAFNARSDAPRADQSAVINQGAPVSATASKQNVGEHSANDLTSKNRNWKHKTAAEATTVRQ